jgi:succinate dehydrogenase / fumarate reductase iron-sulfur subunit
LERKFNIWRGDTEKGEFKAYSIKLERGMVVLDAIHRIQVEHSNDLAVRWNCKAGKCGSCSVEINGRPRLSCMTRMNEFAEDDIITIQPLQRPLNNA